MITHHVDVLDVAAVLGQVHKVDVPGVEGYQDYIIMTIMMACDT